MTLAELCTRLDGATIVGDGQIEIGTVSHDRRCDRGDIIRPAGAMDRFIEMAPNGAAIAVSRNVELDCDVPVLKLSAPRPDLAVIAVEIHGCPADHLTMVGVTDQWQEHRGHVGCGDPWLLTLLKV